MFSSSDSGITTAWHTTARDGQSTTRLQSAHHIRQKLPAMKIATYNVNGVNGRLPVLLRWLEEAAPAVVCLQELKAPQDNFPEAAIRDAGYGRSGTAKRAGTVSPFSPAGKTRSKRSAVF